MAVDDVTLQKLVSVVAAAVSSDGPQPAGFLVNLMAGFDPRERDSRLYRMIKMLDLEDRSPDEDEWAEMKDIVLETDFYKHAPVTLERSHQAARDLMDFLHPKLSRTAVEQVAANRQTVEPLSPAEVETFEDWFFGEF